MNNAVSMQVMQMQLGGSAAPRLRPSHVRASWTAIESCSPAFAGAGAGHVGFGFTRKTDLVIADLTKANPAYHRQPEEILT